MAALSIEVVSSPALTVSLSLANERISVRELLERTVAAQLHELLQEQRLEDEAAAKILARQYLTQAEIDQQAGEGVVRLEPAKGHLDLQREIQRALHGFQKRAFRVVVEGEMLNGLDDELVLTPNTRVTFLRLVPLQGG